MFFLGAACGVSFGFILGLLHVKSMMLRATEKLDRANAAYDRVFSKIDEYEKKLEARRDQLS